MVMHHTKCGHHRKYKVPQAPIHFLIEVVIIFVMLCAESRAIRYLCYVPEQFTTTRVEWFEYP